MEGIRNIIGWKPGNGFIKHAGLADICQNRHWHHGIRLFLLAVLIYLGLILTPGRHTFDPFFDIRTGTVADRDVIAPFDFSIYKSPEELERERQEAANQVLPVLEYLPGVRDKVLEDMNSFFDRLKKAEKDPSVTSSLASWGTYLAKKKKGRNQYAVSPEVLNYLYSVDSLLSLSDEEIVYLFDPLRSRILRSRLKDFLLSRMHDGLISTEELNRISSRQVRLRRDGTEEVIGTSALTSIDQILEQARSFIVDPDNPEVSQNLFLETLRHFIQPNIIGNWAETERQRSMAVGEVKQVRDEQVLKGEKIIFRGERITPQQMERLSSLKNYLESRNMLAGEKNRLKSDFGISLIYLILLGMLGLYFLLYRRDVYNNMSSLLIIGITIFLVMISAYLIVEGQELPNYLIPVAVFSMLVAYLVDDQTALAGTVVLALLLGVQASFSIYLLLLSLAGGSAAAISVRSITSRRGQYISILYIASAYILTILAIDYGYRGENFSLILSASGWSTLNAFVSTLVTIGLLPLFEYVFRITSNFSLRELGDLNRPLLKRLAIEAPGTYHHSIIIGSLAEAAAAGIGANPIYARVAAYYHDIGKLKTPQYFIENQAGRENPHDRLNPKMSSLIISNHVKEGVELARKAKLPEIIIDIIRQHHGDTSISFFYSKEKEKNPESTLIKEDFSYPGPRPKSKETAIIMLADSVESASRTLSDPTPGKIKSMINSLIDKKLREGQLADTDLTLRDLTRIGEEFLTILIGVHHHRIKYPSSEVRQPNGKNKPGNNKTPSEPNGEKTAGRNVRTA